MQKKHDLKASAAELLAQSSGPKAVNKVIDRLRATLTPDQADQLDGNSTELARSYEAAAKKLRAG